MPDTFIVEFDYRSDDGPVRVGPFDSREDADAWLESLPPMDWECNVAPLAAP